MAPRRLHIPELNDPEKLAALYQKFTIPEIAERLGCAVQTVRNRMREYGITRRTGAVPSLQTRIEKAQMAIRNCLDQFDDGAQGIILFPFVDKLSVYIRKPLVCANCLGRDGKHSSWCSMEKKQGGEK